MERLRRRSLEQTQSLFDLLEGYDVATPREPEGRGGFVSVRLERAADVVRELRSRGVIVENFVIEGIGLDSEYTNELRIWLQSLDLE